MRQEAANCDVIDLTPFSRAQVSCKIFQIAGIGLNGVWRSVALAQGEKKLGDRAAYNGFSFRSHSLRELSFRRVERNGGTSPITPPPGMPHYIGESLSTRIISNSF